MAELPQNVKLRFNHGRDALVLSLTQEEHNEGRLNVAVIYRGEFLPVKLWAHDLPQADEREESDVASYVDGEDLAKVLANVGRLASFLEYRAATAPDAEGATND